MSRAGRAGRAAAAGVSVSSSKKKRGAAAWPKGKSSAWGRVQALRLRKGLSALDELREEKGRLIQRTA